MSRLTDYHSSLTTWASNPQMEILRNLFARQAIAMAWDFAEGNPFGDSSGTFIRMVEAVSKVIEYLPTGPVGHVSQLDAKSAFTGGYLVSTDPPYYDNIGYSDLSDFFYVWLRRSLGSVFQLFSAQFWFRKLTSLWLTRTVTGAATAPEFFEAGFGEVFRQT